MKEFGYLILGFLIGLFFWGYTFNRFFDGVDVVRVDRKIVHVFIEGEEWKKP